MVSTQIGVVVGLHLSHNLPSWRRDHPRRTTTRNYPPEVGDREECGQKGRSQQQADHDEDDGVWCVRRRERSLSSLSKWVGEEVCGLGASSSEDVSWTPLATNEWPQISVFTFLQNAGCAGGRRRESGERGRGRPQSGMRVVLLYITSCEFVEGVVHVDEKERTNAWFSIEYPPIW